MQDNKSVKSYQALVAILVLLLSGASRARPTICEYLDLDNCGNTSRSMSRSTSASFPSTVSAAMNNPSALSMEKGFGLESIFYNDQGRVGIASGTGRIGAAVSAASAQETFFSHYALETTNAYRRRRVAGEPFEREDDLSVAAAMNLFGKNRRRGLQMDAGIIYKRNGEKESDHFGGGVSLSFNKVVSAGYSSYKDVLYEDNRNKFLQNYDADGEPYPYRNYYPDIPNNLLDVETETETMSFGLKFGNVAIDHITMTTTFEDEYFDPSTVKILSAAMFYGKWIFTAAQRTEESYRERYQDEKFVQEKRKQAMFLGAQRSIGDYMLIGVFQNYYLLNDVSMGLSVFF